MHYSSVHSRIKKALAGFAAASAVVTASAVVVVVPGTSDPWLAGMPDGTLSNVGTPEPPDVAPTHSPVFVGNICIVGGGIITWSASGIVGHPPNPSGPDGAANSIWSHTVGAEHGMSDIITPIVSLVGVFLGPGQPDLNPAPSTLDFSSAASRDFLNLSPDLQQVFFMGDGVTSSGDAQTITIPAGATRLYLGTMDGYGWANNTGQFDVQIDSRCVPDSGVPAWVTLVVLLGLGGYSRRHLFQAA